MTMARLTVIFLASSFALAACEKDKPKTTDTPAAPANTIQGVRVDGLRKLALVNPEGTSPVDQKILRLQQIAQKDPTKADNWILLGRAWVQKARTAADPGFYANANACADVALDLKPKYA